MHSCRIYNSISVKREYSLQKLCWLERSLGHTYRGRVDVSYQTTLLHKIKYRDSANEVPGDNQGWYILLCRSEFASLVWYGKPMPCSQHLHIQFIILWETKACWGAFASPHPSLGQKAFCLRFLLTTTRTIQIMMRTKKRCIGPGHLPGSFCPRVEEGHRGQSGGKGGRSARFGLLWTDGRHGFMIEK